MLDKPFLSTKEVAQFLDVNEKMIYSLVSEKELPATKITGKWLFPRRMVEQWLEDHIINYPKTSALQSLNDLLILTGSHDILMERTIAFFNRLYPEYMAVFGNIGSLRGLKSLGQGTCHIAMSHLLQHDEKEYNFEFASQELGGELAAIVNFCHREQGFIVEKDNPKQIQNIETLQQKGIRVANRPLGTGTRLLLDTELHKVGINGTQIEGYQNEFQSHWDAALEVLAGRADMALGIRAVAGLLGLDFIPLRWERYDLLIAKNRFFEEGVQLFLNILHEEDIKKLAGELSGYDLSECGKMIFQHSTSSPT